MIEIESIKMIFYSNYVASWFLENIFTGIKNIGTKFLTYIFLLIWLDNIYSKENSVAYDKALTASPIKSNNFLIRIFPVESNFKSALMPIWHTGSSWILIDQISAKVIIIGVSEPLTLTSAQDCQKYSHPKYINLDKTYNRDDSIISSAQI